MRLVEINCEVDKLIENCDTAKVDAVVSAKKLKEEYGDVENLIGKNYDFLIFGDFIGDMDELNYGVSNKELVDIFEFFYKSDQEKKLFEKYKFRPPLRAKMKLEINYKLKFHIIYTATEFFMEIQVRDGIADNNIKSLV